jgi:hypothetical protein
LVGGHSFFGLFVFLADALREPGRGVITTTGATVLGVLVVNIFLDLLRRELGKFPQIIILKDVSG